MGCGLTKVAPLGSLPESTEKGFFVSAEASEVARIFVRDANSREAFVQYLKSSVWLDHLAKPTRLDDHTTACSDRLDPWRRSSIFEYEAAPAVDLCQVQAQAALSNAERLFGGFALSPRSILSDRSSRSTRVSLAERSSRSSGVMKHNSVDSRDECYLPLEDICDMSEEQLMAIMTGIVLPIFVESSEWKAVKAGSSSDLGRSPSFEQSTACITSSSKRAQDLLLSCAARFDGDILLVHLQESAWLSTLQSAFHDFPLPISVCDTNRDTCPLVYVNRAFEELVGRPSRKLLGKRLNVLNGPDTELALFERLLEAQRCNLPCKVAITHYAAKGSERFLDLLALRPSGGYSFAVHCPANRSTLAEDLKMVDDALMLLAYVVKAPPVRKLQRGQSWVPSIHNLRAMSHHLHL